MADAWNRTTSVFTLEIDGEEFDFLNPTYRTGPSECHSVLIPPNNARGFAPGPETFASDGYSVLLKGLCPGSHVVRYFFTAGPPDNPNFSIDVLYHLEIEPYPFRRGDCNDDGTVDISDAVCILNWLFAGDADPGCVAATNTNGDDAANITDATYLLNHLFAGGPAPAQPFPDCGPGPLPADAELGCENPPDC